MINSKETLKKLHQALPNLTLDELFTILDCYTEECIYTYRDFEPSKIWYNTVTTTGDTVPYTSKITAIDAPYPTGGISSEIKSHGNISITTKKPDYQFATGH